jgi:hypothetical protein
MDATGHMDWPGAGPFTSQVYIDGMATDYYTHWNGNKGGVELIKINRTGKDTWVRDFPSEVSAHLWLREGNRP